ncbi:MAG: hypothetical protein ACHBN1_24790 [Heteroscytonema crispum UTEX LB 1556]
MIELPFKLAIASPPTNNAIALHQSPGSGKRHCDPWPDPKTAVAPLPLGAK